MKIHYWKLKPSYIQAIYSDFLRVFKKTSLYKTCKKYPEATLYGVASILGVIFLLTAKVLAQSPPLVEAGLERIEITQYKTLGAIKAPKVQYASIKVAAVRSEPTNVPDGCVPDNKWASFIYMKESGCNPSAVNGAGCRGLGQACPGDKLPCDADFECQHKWFTGYAEGRYGSWEAAYNFWVANHWW